MLHAYRHPVSRTHIATSRHTSPLHPAGTPTIIPSASKSAVSQSLHHGPPGKISTLQQLLLAQVRAPQPHIPWRIPSTTITSHRQMSLHVDARLRPCRSRLQPSVSTILSNVRHCNSGPAHSTQFPISRSKSVSIPVSRNAFHAQPLTFQHDQPQPQPPDLIVSKPSEEDLRRRCEGRPCPFFAHDPDKYPQCRGLCTAHGLDPEYWLRRHLKDKHQGDVSEDALSIAIASLRVNGVKTKMFDGRRVKQTDRLHPDLKLAALYKEACRILFRTDEKLHTKVCGLPVGHVQRRVRSVKKSVDGTSDRGRVSHARTSRTTSRAASRTSSVAIDASADSEVPPSDVQQDVCQARIDNICKRLSGISRVSHQFPSFLDGFYVLLDHNERHLSHMERQLARQTATMALQGSLPSSMPNSFDTHRPTMFQDFSQPSTSPQYPASENDIELFTDHGNIRMTPASTSQYSPNGSHVPQSETWQESMQSSPQTFQTPLSSNFFQPPLSPSMLTAEMPGPQFIGHNPLLLDPNAELRNTFLLDDSTSDMTWPPPSIQIPSYNNCSICRLGLEICIEHCQPSL